VVASKENGLSFHRYVEFNAPGNALDDKDRILVALREAAGILKSQVLDESVHKFEPQGVTALLLLSTSHLAIHTWPEHEMAQLDVLSCNKEVPVEPAVEHIVEALGGTVTKIRKASQPWLVDGDLDDVLKGSGVKPSDETPGHPFFRTFGILTPFGESIMPLFPKEAPRTYAELFCGNVEMLWCHPKRAQREVINDLDKDIVRLHRICQGLTDADLAKLAKMEWQSSAGMFDRLVKAQTPKGDLEFFHRELYIRRFSKFGRAKPRYAEFSSGGTMQPFNRIRRCRARLQGVEISNRDYREAIKRYDAPDTFWEIDPPYPEEQGYYPFKMPDLGEQADHYQRLKGQAMIIIEGSRESLRPLIEMKGWREFKFRWPRKWYHTPRGPKEPWVWGSMFVNYDPPGKARKAAWDVGLTKADGPSDETPKWPWFKTFGMLGRFAEKILPTFPSAFKTYVEVFCGNGEMIWCHKRKAETEVLNDLDPDIVRLHTFCRDATDAQLEKLERDFDWVGRETTFHKIVKTPAPTGELAWVHRQLYLRRFSKWGINRLGQFYEISEGSTMRPFDRIRRCRARTKGVKVENLDYRKVIAKYDSPDTLFFIDPPYPEESGLYKLPLRDVEEQAKVYEGIKGKAVIVIQGRHKSLDPLRGMKGWHETNFRWPKGWYGRRTDNHIKEQFVVASIFTNFDPKVGKGDDDPEFVFEMIKASVRRAYAEEVLPAAFGETSDGELVEAASKLGEVYDSADEDDRLDVVKMATRVWDEMDRRGLVVDDTTTLYRDAVKAGDRATAETRPGSNGGADPVGVDDILPSFEKPIVLRAPAVSVVGSACTQSKTRGDVDVLLHGPLSDEVRKVVEFRIGRALPPSLSKRVEFHRDDLGGPFTDHVPLYDLALVPSERRQMVRMSAELVASLFKQDNPTLTWPEKTGPRPAVVQVHTRGRTAHLDLRMKVNGTLIGWTLFAQRPGEVPDVDGMDKARALYQGYDAERGNRYLKPILAPSKMRVTQKQRQPAEWLDIEGEVFGEGEIGATSREKGVMVAVARPMVEWGLQLPQFHEYFLTGDKTWRGILYVRLAVESGDETVWTAWLGKSYLPSVLKTHAVKTGEMPPLGRSAMPTSLMDATPSEHRFWEAKTEREARAMRDALVGSSFFTPENVRLVDGSFRRVVTKHYLFKADAKPGDDGMVECSISVKTFKNTWHGCDPGWICSDDGCAGKCCQPGGKGATVVVTDDEAKRLRKRGIAIKNGAIDLGDGRYCPCQDEDGLCKLHKTGDKPLTCVTEPLKVLSNGTIVVRDRFFLLKCFKVGGMPGYKAWEGAFKRLFGDSQTKRIQKEIEAGADKVTAKMDAKLFETMVGLDSRRISNRGGAYTRREKNDDGALEETLAKSADEIPIVKTKDEQYVLGVVLEPNDGRDGAPLDPDTQRDIYSRDEIRQSAHRFMEDFRNIGFMHRTLINGKVKILESYLSPVEFWVTEDGTTYSEKPKGSEKVQHVREGTWLLGLRIADETLWAKVKDGKLSGLSIGGSARRVSARG